MASRGLKAVGRNVLRKEGIEKVTGAARYLDDLPFSNLLHARTIRSTIPAGEIADIRFNFNAAGFDIVDYRDIPGRNVVALIEDDQPCLAERSIRHVAEPILILAHEDRERLIGAEVQIDYRPSTPVFDAESSPTTFKRIAIVKAIDSVARRLGNTKAVCRKCYIHPAILDAYMDGATIDAVKASVTRLKSRGALTGEEIAVVGMIERRLRKTA